MQSPKVFLVHGENEYLIYKDLRDLKKTFTESGTEFTHLAGSKDLLYRQIYDSLNSDSLFAAESNLIIENISEGLSLFPFVEKIVENIEEISKGSSSLYIYHRGKVAKNIKIYKAISKVGTVKEHTNPDKGEIIGVIKKSIAIENDAADLLADYVNGNLFQLKNELKKLSNLITKDKKEINSQDIKSVCVKLFAKEDTWGIGKNFIDAVIEKNSKTKAELLQNMESLLIQEVATMQILYGFYSYVLNFIKMKAMIKKGKGFRDCLSMGYYFVKDYFNKANLVDEKQLYELNSKLLDYEFNLKTGNIDEVNGLRKLLLNL
jgi:DNA polymerase III delta subunit